MHPDFLPFHYQIQTLWGEENLSRYEPGGFHPVHLGDLFKEGRYKIVDKLGFGGSSTVWLARDYEQQQWVSLKILTADATHQSRELQMLSALQKDDSINHVVHLLDSFVHEGLNGRHQCLVLELLGPSVAHVVNSDYWGADPKVRLEPDVVLRITKQLLEGLSSVHKAGYAQGDVSAKNIAFTSSCLRDCSEDELTEILGSPRTEELRPVDSEPLKASLPKYVIGSTEWDSWIDEDDEDIRLIDWGEAFVQGAEPAKIGQPFGLRAPETFFTSRIDYKIDLWGAGCIIYHLIIDRFPFRGYGFEGVIGDMINFIEDLPAEWRPKWEEMKRTTTNGVDQILEYPKPDVPRLEQNFRDVVHEPELQVLLPIMQGLMRFLPENRISATDALSMLEKSVQSHDEAL